MSATLKSSDAPRGRRKTLPFQIALLLVLLVIAAFVWTRPARRERALASASLSELQEAAKQNPNSARIFHYLGLRQEQQGNVPVAFDAYARAADLDPDAEADWLASSRLSEQLYGDQGALDLLAVYLKRHPQSAPAHLARARLYYKNQSYQHAWDEAVAATKAAPRLAEAWYVAGLAADATRQPAQAETTFKQAVTLAPQDWRYQMVYGDALAEQKRTSEALLSFREALRLAPQEAAPYVSLGKLQLDTATTPSELDAARQSLERGLAIQPQMAQARILLGRCYIRQGRWQDAKTQLEQAQQLAPTDFTAPYELTRVYRKLGDVTAAAHADRLHKQLQVYQSQKTNLRVALTPENAPVILLQLARLCGQHGDDAEALQYYRRYHALRADDAAVNQEAETLRARLTSAASAIPSSTSALAASAALEQADALFTQQQFSRAEVAYIAILKKDKNNARALQGLGLTLVAEARPDQALFFLEAAVKQDPNLLPARAALAEHYLRQGYPLEARRRIREVVEREPNNAAYWHLLGSACSNADPYLMEAEDAFKRAVALDTRNPGYLFDYADILAKNNKMDAAEATFRQAQQLFPNDPEMLSRFGMFLAMDRTTPAQHQEAETLLKGALAARPDDAFALYALGKLALARGDAGQAVTYLKDAIHNAKEVDVADLWYALYRAYLRQGDKTQAQKALAKADHLHENYQQMRLAEELLEKKPKDVALRLKLARIYVERGEETKAITQYAACLSLEPHNSVARRERDTLVNRLKAAGKLTSILAYNSMMANLGKDAPAPPGKNGRSE